MSLGATHRRPPLAALAASLTLFALLAEAQEVLTPAEFEQLFLRELPEGFSLPPNVLRAREQQEERVTGGVETRYFRILGEYASLGVPVEDLGALFDEAFEYVRDRVGLPPDAVPQSQTVKIEVWIRPPSSAGRAMNCPQRGAAGGNQIVLYADGTTSQTQLIGVLAHEVGHVLMPRVLGGYYDVGGLIMNEGYATWAAGRYVLDWIGVESLQIAVARQLTDGSWVSLLAPLGDYYAPSGEVVASDLSDTECFARRDLAYSRWGGFIEYLVEREGPEALVTLLRSGRRMLGLVESLDELRVAYAEAQKAPASGESPSTPPLPRGLRYDEVYGLDLAALEGAWLESLKDTRTN